MQDGVKLRDVVSWRDLPGMTINLGRKIRTPPGRRTPLAGHGSVSGGAGMNITEVNPEPKNTGLNHPSSTFNATYFQSTASANLHDQNLVRSPAGGRGDKLYHAQATQDSSLQHPSHNDNQATRTHQALGPRRNLDKDTTATRAPYETHRARSNVHSANTKSNPPAPFPYRNLQFESNP